MTAKEVIVLLRRLLSVSLVIILILSFTSCKKKEVSHKTGWQNPDTPTTTEITEDESIPEEVSSEKSEEATTQQSQSIRFSEKDAIKTGEMTSEVYGKLTVYFQDNYFLLIDDFGDLRFTVFAEGYAPLTNDKKTDCISSDMNFDGNTDFGVCYYKDTLNSYYFCFLWDRDAKDFSYYLPLSSLANPEFDFAKKTVTATEKLTTDRATEKVYTYVNDELTLVSTKEKTEEKPQSGAETVDANLSVTENGRTASVILKANEKSHSKWICTVEDENVVIASTEYYNIESNSYEFLLTGIAPGATTVIFRYVSLVSGEYIEEIVINAITNADSSVKIVIPE